VLRVAFLSDRDGNFEVYRANGNGSAILRLTDLPEFNQVWAQGWAPLP